MRTRSLTALFFAIVMICGTWSSAFTFSLLFLAIALLCTTEYFNLSLQNEPSRLVNSWVRKGLGYLAITLLYLHVAFGTLNDASSPQWLQSLAKLFTSKEALLILMLIVPMLLINEVFAQSPKPFEQAGLVLLAVLYIGLPFTLLLTLSVPVVFGYMLLVWSNDIFAYLIGSRWGKRKLLPRISPGKTWEGTGGAAIVTLVLSVLIGWFYLTQGLYARSILWWTIVATIAIVFGTIGDLIESMLKRSYAAKDSGSLLPGHGGFLDRFDAFIFGIPFLFAFELLSS